jgi:plastocyanin
MKSKIIPISVIAALVAFGLLAAGCGSAATTRSIVTKAPKAASAPKTATAIITHVVKGCHDWSVNGNTAAADQTVKLSQGGTLTVTDNDVMPHTLIQSKGPAASISGGKMSHAGAQSTVSFPSPGVYNLTTKAGEDYTKGVTTTGADHVLKLTVVVS